MPRPPIPWSVDFHRAGQEMSGLTLLLRSTREAGAPVDSVRRNSHFPLLTLCVAFASASSAQEIVASSDAELTQGVIDEIVVTGSRIKRRDFNTLSPLTTIDNEDIAFTGQATIEETLNQMPQVIPGSGRTSNLPWEANAGTATVDLRGLGPHRSLILLNGRRVAPSGTGNAVDLNNIPQRLFSASSQRRNCGSGHNSRS